MVDGNWGVGAIADKLTADLNGGGGLRLNPKNYHRNYSFKISHTINTSGEKF